MAVIQAIRRDAPRSAASAEALDRARQIGAGTMRPRYDLLSPTPKPANPLRLSDLLRDGVLKLQDLPAADDLPAKLRPLTRRNARPVVSGTFDHDITELIDKHDGSRPCGRVD